MKRLLILLITAVMFLLITGCDYGYMDGEQPYIGTEKSQQPLTQDNDRNNNSKDYDNNGSNNQDNTNSNNDNNQGYKAPAINTDNRVNHHKANKYGIKNIHTGFWDPNGW